jgi:outer membrane protein assembly factor BamB
MNPGKAFFILINSAFIVLLCPVAKSQTADWTQFRGSHTNGIAEKDNIPLKWDNSVIKWKKEIHDRGHSSPVVLGNQIWLTTAKEDESALFAVCLDFGTGDVIYDIKVFTSAEPEEKHQLNTYATPTPCVENGFVYVHYGNAGTACINTSNGRIVWKNSDLRCKFVQGAASSPVLYKDLLILHYEGVDKRFLVALNKKTGKIVWKTDRPEEPYKPLTEIGRKAYITPLIMNVKGKDLLISDGSAICIAYEPMTGKEVWRVINGAESTIAMPVEESGIVYWYTGYMIDTDGSHYTEFLSVDPDGKGDIAATNILWKKKDGLAHNQMLTPVIKDGLIYTVNSRNMMMCLNAKSGEELWSVHVMSDFDASPLYINGNVWFFSSKGDVIVIKAGRNYEVISKNKVESGIFGTPAIVRNSMLLRTQNYIYKISAAQSLN